MKVKTDYVPEDSRSYLTPGKVYELVNTIDDHGGWTSSDNGDKIFISAVHSAHIGNRDWEVVSYD